MCLFFFMAFLSARAQEILWKGKELQSGAYKTIEGEITIRTPEDTIRASKAIIYSNPKKAILKGNLSLVRTGTRVTGDSGIYFPGSRTAQILGNARIFSPEGEIRSQSFFYNLDSKVLSSPNRTEGESNGIRFSGNQCLIFSGSRNMKLYGNATWENDTIKGSADTLYLDKANGTLKMSKKARIVNKKKMDEVTGSFIELDLKANKISRIKGSKIKRDNFQIKAKDIKQQGEDYDLAGEVEIASQDSSIRSSGTKAQIRKIGMDMEGPTITRITDSEKKATWIYAPKLNTRKSDSLEKYYFYKNTNIRGQFNGYADSIFIWKKGPAREIFLYENAHLQNDTLYMEADTLELYQDSTTEILRARRNAMLVMVTPPNRINVITAAYVELRKSKNESDLKAIGASESWLWNDEKENTGLNHTLAPEQRAKVLDKKVSRIRTKGNSSSEFKPLKKVEYGYLDPVSVKIKESISGDSLSPGLQPVPHFLRIQRKK